MALQTATGRSPSPPLTQFQPTHLCPNFCPRYLSSTTTSSMCETFPHLWMNLRSTAAVAVPTILEVDTSARW